MALSERPYAPRGQSQFFFPVAVKWLIISNTVLFVLYFLAHAFSYDQIFSPFLLVPGMVVQFFMIWQLVTYMFLHSPLGFQHILFNMLMLWFFGVELEQAWGTKKFLKYYFFCGIGAGISVVIANALFGSMSSRTLGASGAIYGLILAFVLMDPERIVNFNFVFPIKAKYMGLILGGISFLSTITDSGGGVSHVAHLGGMLWGYAFLRTQMGGKRPIGFRAGQRKEVGIFEQAQRSYHEWKMERARRKFQVYMNKNREK